MGTVKEGLESQVRGTLDGATVSRQPMFTLPDMMTRLGHKDRHLNVLKVDCEGCEWASLGVLPASFWQRVDQMSLELHYSDGLMLDTKKQVRNAASLASALQTAGFVEWRTSVREGWPWHRHFLPELVEAGLPAGLCCRLIGYMRKRSWGSWLLGD